MSWAVYDNQIIYMPKKLKFYTSPMSTHNFLYVSADSYPDEKSIYLFRYVFNDESPPNNFPNAL